jgi:uridine kinase
MDGFHRPRARRYKQGRHSALGYYEDAYDFASLAHHVLVPLGPGGDFRNRRAVIDLASDTPVDEPAVQLQQSAVLIVDGTFLQKPEIADLWDTTIFVHTSLDVARRRGVTRDAEALGGTEKADTAFTVRYHAASQMYLDEARPAKHASLVFDNDDLDHPSVRMANPESS